MRVRFNAVAGERPVTSLTSQHHDATIDELLCEQCSPDFFSVRPLDALEDAGKWSWCSSLNMEDVYLRPPVSRVRFARRRCGQDDFIDGC